MRIAEFPIRTLLVQELGVCLKGIRTTREYSRPSSRIVQPAPQHPQAPPAPRTRRPSAVRLRRLCWLAGLRRVCMRMRCLLDFDSVPWSFLSLSFLSASLLLSCAPLLACFCFCKQPTRSQRSKPDQNGPGAGGSGAGSWRREPDGVRERGSERWGRRREQGA